MPLSVNVKPLPGYMIATEAAEYLGVTKQTIHKMMEADKFQTMYSIGSKPVYLLLTSEVQAMKKERDKLKARKEAKAARRAASELADQAAESVVEEATV